MRRSAMMGRSTVILLLAMLAGCAPKARQAGAPADTQRIAIAVTERGFEPERITVHAGEPVTLVVTRKTDQTCATEFVIKDEGINRPLPLDQPVAITFTPRRRGELSYACGMDMVRGQILVR
jgi:plastocyanin domain-containing protein